MALPIEEAWPAQEVASVPQALDKLVAFLRARLGSCRRRSAIVWCMAVRTTASPSSSTIRCSTGSRPSPRSLHCTSPTISPRSEPSGRASRSCCRSPASTPPFIAVIRRSPIATLFPTLYAEGVRRYGFHGLSYEYIANRLPEIAPNIARGHVVVAHLGSGASMCAISAGKSVESTLGFTALDGLPMGTRPGQLDPGIVLYLMQEKGMSAKDIEHFLYNECGLKGMSGISNDVRDLLASKDPRAKLTLDYFTYRISLYAGMLAAAMGGIDGFVFTAGIGENAPAIREAVAGRLAWLGLDFDRESNASGKMVISRSSSRVACYVIPTDEELMIARHTLAVLRAQRNALEEKPT